MGGGEELQLKLSPTKSKAFLFTFFLLKLRRLGAKEYFVSSMGRFIILSTLLLGLVGVVNGQFLDQNENRQDFAPVDGCVPGKSNGACPVRMECFADKNFENGGRCDCKLKRACV